MGGSSVGKAAAVVCQRQVGWRYRDRIGVTAAPRPGWPLEHRAENEAFVPRHTHCREGGTVPRRRAPRAGLIPACPERAQRQQCLVASNYPENHPSRSLPRKPLSATAPANALACCVYLLLIDSDILSTRSLQSSSIALCSRILSGAASDVAVKWLRCWRNWIDADILWKSSPRCWIWGNKLLHVLEIVLLHVRQRWSSNID